jgi:hypothetical protein
MRSRPFYRLKRFWLGLFVLGVMAILAGSVMWVPSRAEMNARRRALSPDGGLMAFALPYHGAASQGYEGGLVVYLSGKESTVIDKHQTSLKGTRVTRLEWNAGAVPKSFRVWDEDADGLEGGG